MRNFAAWLKIIYYILHECAAFLFRSHTAQRIGCALIALLVNIIQKFVKRVLGKRIRQIERTKPQEKRPQHEARRGDNRRLMERKMRNIAAGEIEMNRATTVDMSRGNQVIFLNCH
jgi:hypothetical protein